MLKSLEQKKRDFHLSRVQPYDRAVLHADWSADSKVVRTGSTSRELLYHEAPGGRRLTRAPRFHVDARDSVLPLSPPPPLPLIACNTLTVQPPTNETYLNETPPPPPPSPPPDSDDDNDDAGEWSYYASGAHGDTPGGCTAVAGGTSRAGGTAVVGGTAVSGGTSDGRGGWDTWTTPLGFELMGVWPRGADGTDINGTP